MAFEAALRSTRVIALFGLSMWVMVGVSSASADDPCAAFTWDVHRERALFGTNPQILTSGQTLGASPTLAAGRLYQVELRAQGEVKFLEPPGKKSGDNGAFAGLVQLTVETAGVYRISLDQPMWVDVIANGTVVPAKDFQGRAGCNAPHKIVEFLLPAGSPITLQLSASSVAVVKITVTRSPGGMS